MGGANTGAFTAGSNGAGSSAMVALSGTGALPPGLAVNPAALVLFGTTGVGEAATAMVVTVTNQGTLTALTGILLTVNATGQAAGFGVSGNTCGTVLAVGSSCHANVTFTPTGTGLLGGTLQVTSTNGSTPVDLTLQGTGFDFKMAVVGAGSMTVAPGQTGYYTFNVTPAGAASGAFSLTCGTLPANTVCVFNPATLNGLAAGVSGLVTLGLGTEAASANVRRAAGRPGETSRRSLNCKSEWRFGWRPGSRPGWK